MNLFLLLVPAATALFLVLPLIRPVDEEEEGSEREEEARRMEAEILAEIDGDRERGLADGEDREEFLRRTGGDPDA